jgi:cytochrome c nitrite reductase small subunit
MQKLPRKIIFPVFFLIGVIFVFLARAGMDATATNEYCESCHFHPQATQSWKLSVHHDTESGIVVNCVDCHLPPKGFAHLYEKSKAGIRDLYGKWTNEPDEINWEVKSRREHAVKFVFKESCVHCHQNLFPKGLTKKGQDAHLHYEAHAEELRCLNCHLDVGHYQERPAPDLTFMEVRRDRIFERPARVDSFVDFSEQIPGTVLNFEMVAIPGGEFAIGSPESEAFREPDEGPQRRVRVSDFWMGRAEVSWDLYDAFFRATGGEGRTQDQVKVRAKQVGKFDAITGPTPAYGNPDQGWGRGERPAITMTHHGATVFCQWLSQVTGRQYRLPTEAEWEYAARGGSEGAYFFEGDPEAYSDRGFWNSIFGADTSVISRYVIYNKNSEGKSHLPGAVNENGFGLVHMLGNVWEFCSDWYAGDIYSNYADAEVVVDPSGPPSGDERVIRGGSYYSDAADVRVAMRSHTRRAAWLMTDPQVPKSLWWYSDNMEVGFRVVCEVPAEIRSSH